jgi:NitT/TauT family transport system substrate-binding protein
MKKSFPVFLTIIMVIFVIVGCSQKASTTGAAQGAPIQLTKIKYAQLQASLTDIHFQFAVEKGIYSKNGIDLQIINFDKGGPEALAAASSGQVDMGNFGTPILTGISKGIPIKIVGSPPITENPFVLVARKDIKSLQDLKGLTVATGALGGGSHQALLKILAVNGLKESDVKIVATGGTDAEMILSSGKAGAVITTEPTVSKIELDGIGKTLIKAQDVFGVYQHSFVFATDKLIKNNPDAVRKILKSNQEANKYAAEHVEEVVAYAAKKLGLSEDLVSNFYKKTIPTWNINGSVNVEATQNAFKVLQDLKEVDKSYSGSPDLWYNSQFLPK